MSFLKRLFPPPQPIKKIQRRKSSTSIVAKKVVHKKPLRRESSAIMLQTLRQHPNVTALELKKLLKYDNIQSIYTLVSYNKAKIVKTRDGAEVRYRVKFARAPKTVETKPLTTAPVKKRKYAFEDPEIQQRAIKKAAELRKAKSKSSTPKPRGWADPAVRHAGLLKRWPNHVCNEKCPGYEKTIAEEMIEELTSSKIPDIGAMVTTVAKPSVFNVKQACETSNISLAAALYARSHKLLDVKMKPGGNGSFVFEQNAQFIFESQQFWGRQLPVDARTYHESLRLLRSKLANL